MDHPNNKIWEVTGDTLLVRDGKRRIIPSATQVYESIIENKQVFSGLVPSVPKYLSGISFSRYPVSLSVEIYYTPEPGCKGIYCRVLAISKDGNVPIEHFRTREADHIVISGRWYPFEPGSVQQVNEILDTTGVGDVGVIPFRAYLKIRKLAQTLDLVLDRTEGEVIQLGITANQDLNVPRLFKGKLYPYQLNGWRWLSFLLKEQLGGILADEMGLGKTVQIITALTDTERDSVSPALVIAPSTLLENWRREILKFSPSLVTTIHQGPTRTGTPSILEGNDIVITSYDTVVRDGALFYMIVWKIVVLDEAQAIKNPRTKRAVSVKGLKRQVSIAVTGTPVENRLRDLWSLMDFVLPGYLGSESEFEQWFANDENAATELEQLVSPMLLRRKIQEVAQDLPDRIKIPQILDLDGEEIDEYEHVREEIIEEYGKNAPLVALTKLRMFCTHPFLLNQEGPRGRDILKFGKFARLLEILEEIFENGEKALVFTSYNMMSDLIVEQVGKQFGIYSNYIDGRTPGPKRQEIVDRFASKQLPGVLALNPRAAGTGLNITAANHVIHYNLEWNPAIEDQASARAYRRGQDKPVTIHRLYYANTVEEVIDQRLERKRNLANMAIVGVTGKEEEYEDIIRALQLTPVAIR